jgi:soluble lytic murein transglycosylase-like protein
LKSKRITAVAAFAAMTLCAPARASTPHTVVAGNTLWSIATANGISPSALAAANGLPVDAQVVLGTTIQIPAAGQAGATAADVPGDAGDAGEAEAGVTGASSPPALGGYTVQPGDTLSAIAARSGKSVGEVAWMNGLDPAAPLLAGTALKLPTGAPTPAAQAAPTHVPSAAPYPTSGFSTSSEIAQIAAQHGVPGSLAAAIAWQESGFNNGMVSSANARGVMQVMPGTWDWVQRNLATTTLNPASPQDNVHAGVLYLGSLLRATGGDPAAAAAAYYQGLGSVRAQGVLPETQRYVDNVMALRPRFGG